MFIFFILPRFLTLFFCIFQRTRLRAWLGLPKTSVPTSWARRRWWMMWGLPAWLSRRYDIGVFEDNLMNIPSFIILISRRWFMFMGSNIMQKCLWKERRWGQCMVEGDFNYLVCMIWCWNYNKIKVEKGKCSLSLHFFSGVHNVCSLTAIIPVGRDGHSGAGWLSHPQQGEWSQPGHCVNRLW